ncbi:unnamed protein product [Cochlearia groenlandica]
MLSTTLSGNYGFPLCLSGISQQQLSLSKEMADHDKRRKGMKKRRRSQAKEDMRESDDIRDLVALLQDLLSWSFSSHTAKAA